MSVLLLAGLVLPHTVQAQQRHTVLLISIDGMRPDYVTKAEVHGLKIPNLRRLMADGTYAEGVVGVVPTVTYPSHTTLVTGVWPAQHGILTNTTFDPERKNFGGWYWYYQDVKVPSLWTAAHAAGLKTGSVSWPVTVGAPVDYLIPEFWRANTADDRKLLAAVSTPGLLASLEKQLGPYSDGLQTDVPNDQIRTNFADAILREDKPEFMAVHLAALDHAEHQHGPFSPQANDTLEALDGMVGQLEKTVLRNDPNAVICIVSDHGFATVHHQVNLLAAFIQAGLIQMGQGKSYFGGPTVASWQAVPWLNGGSAAIVLKDPKDEAVLRKTAALLHKLAAEPANGIDRIVGQKALQRLGGFPHASFLVDLKPGWETGSSLSRPVNAATPATLGTHGYLPQHPELRASFFIAGPGIARGKDLGMIDMRSIAPTLAREMGASLPSASGKLLPLQ
jgi:predicted AlkP superfamily pyrophosphatase or phosphodiesterase